jgi:enoyl-CoA hydratase
MSARGGVARIELDGPTTRNAIDYDSVAELVAACAAIDADPAIGVAVVTGLHGAFCSGASRTVLAELARSSPSEAYERLDRLYAGFERVRRLAVPTVARIDGAAVGAGLNLALVTDLRIASTSARFVSGFSPNAIHPGGGHLHLLGQAGGRHAAAAMGLFAETLDAAAAQAAGLVWRVVPESDLDAAVEAATASAASDPELARALKSSIDRTAGSIDSWAAAIEVERARQMWSLTRVRSQRQQEGHVSAAP